MGLIAHIMMYDRIEVKHILEGCSVTLIDMTKFTINPRVVYSGDTCYVTIAAFIVISQSIYLLTHLGARTSTMSC